MRKEVKALAVASLVAICGVGALLGFHAFTSRQLAPEVQFQTIQGAAIATSDLRGKVVLINFWSTDCVACLKEMPALVDTYNRFKAQGFETVAVAMKYDPPHHVVAYAERNRLPFSVAIDLQGVAARDFGDVRATPTTFVIDRRGYIASRYLGEPDFQALHRLLEKKLKEPA